MFECVRRVYAHSASKRGTILPIKIWCLISVSSVFYRKRPEHKMCGGDGGEPDRTAPSQWEPGQRRFQVGRGTWEMYGCAEKNIGLCW